MDNQAETSYVPEIKESLGILQQKPLLFYQLDSPTPIIDHWL
jgi:hypothetical protein